MQADINRKKRLSLLSMLSEIKDPFSGLKRKARVEGEKKKSRKLRNRSLAPARRKPEEAGKRRKR